MNLNECTLGMVVEVVGNTCVAFSPSGNREGYLHESTVVLIVWAARTRVRRPELIITECHSSFATKVWEFWFGDLYEIHRVVCEPVTIGYPAYRPRVFHWLVRRDWNFEGTSDDFLRRSRRSVEVDGDTIMIAPKKKRDNGGGQSTWQKSKV